MKYAPTCLACLIVLAAWSSTMSLQADEPLDGDSPIEIQPAPKGNARPPLPPLEPRPEAPSVEAIQAERITQLEQQLRAVTERLEVVESRLGRYEYAFRKKKSSNPSRSSAPLPSR